VGVPAVSVASDELEELIRELGITGTPVFEMWADPERAVAVLRHAKKGTGLRNRAAFAVANWQTGFDPRPSTRPEPPAEQEHSEPPSLSGLEYMWSVPQTKAIEYLLEAAGEVIALAGGFNAAIRPTFDEIEHFDFD
jgi:hypothetical protein